MTGINYFLSCPVMTVSERMGPSIIILLSTLLCWSYGAPNPSPAYGIFPLPQVYNNRAPGGFYYFPSLDSVRQQLTPISRDDLHQSDVAQNPSRTGTQYSQSMKMFNLSPGNIHFQCL